MIICEENSTFYQKFLYLNSNLFPKALCLKNIVPLTQHYHTNTDGIIHKLVMVFANPAPKTDPAKTCTRTPAPARNINPAP
jgi:hypothetical protein